MAQANKICPHCNAVGHSGFYCPDKPRKPIKRTAIKQKDFLGKSAKINVGEKFADIKKPKKKAKSRSWYVKELDRVFSTYIRQKNAIDGFATCVTCGVSKRWQEQQNGHYMSRGHLPTRWSEDNCHVQCVGCNLFKKGNYTEYSLYMINTYGAEKLTELKIRANSGEKIPTSVLKYKIEEYKQKLLT